MVEIIYFSEDISTRSPCHSLYGRIGHDRVFSSSLIHLMLQLTPGLLAGQGLLLVAHNEPRLQRLLVVDRQLGSQMR